MTLKAREMGKDKSEKKEKKRKAAEAVSVAPAGDVEMEEPSSVRFLIIKCVFHNLTLV